MVKRLRGPRFSTSPDRNTKWIGVNYAHNSIQLRAINGRGGGFRINYANETPSSRSLTRFSFAAVPHRRPIASSPCNIRHHFVFFIVLTRHARHLVTGFSTQKTEKGTPTKQTVGGAFGFVRLALFWVSLCGLALGRVQGTSLSCPFLSVLEGRRRRGGRERDGEKSGMN